MLRRHAADDHLPIFDAHVHYSSDAWVAYGPQAVFEKLDSAGVSWALVSSTPDDGTLALHSKNDRRIVPELRPYHDDFHAGNWYRTPKIIPYLEARLKNGIYRGIGEFHLNTQDSARTPTMRRVAALAVANNIPLHVHSGAGPVAALFALEPELKSCGPMPAWSSPPRWSAKCSTAMTASSPKCPFAPTISRRAAPSTQRGETYSTATPTRFMIGTDTYINDRWDVYGSLIDEHRNWLGQLPPNTRTAIAHGNATRIFAIAAPSQ